GRFKFYKADICNAGRLEEIFQQEKPKIVVHFAAESHVDRSILSSSEFIQTNIAGTQTLLDACKKHGIKKFIHVSTDEVYGDIEIGKFHETTALSPNSPYSASKAAGDLLVKSYIRTFQFPALIIRPSNNYGPWQYPEKFIPVIIYKALNNEKIPVYGKGMNIREWLYVSDCADAILKITEGGKIGEIYNLGSGNERQNIEIVKTILRILNKPLDLVSYVKDRPGHDFRYSLDFSKLKKELGWKPQVSLEDGLLMTVNWYKDNFIWLEKKVSYLRSYWKKVYKQS
ncbi:MAG: dTDP-glucose 4,6-dehydratase, partial [Candidatus Omnitrophica bacterium]|nr:dTDP-glucose 4,6-dehydratase [Candidatus Omnitrophota bacterium]